MQKTDFQAVTFSFLFSLPNETHPFCLLHPEQLLAAVTEVWEFLKVPHVVQNPREPF